MITTSPLDATDIQRRLTADTVGVRLHLYAEVASTNATLRELARAGAPAGTVVLAEAQTAGRGRHGASWFSPAGVNLYASVLFRPRVVPSEIGVFTFVASLALSDAVKEQGVAPAIKWPNDVLVAGRKVGGALVESAVRDEDVEWVVVGIGVNLNVEPRALREALGDAGRYATSLAAERGREIDRNAFAASYLNHLDRWAATWADRGPEAVLAAWRDLDILTGRRVEIRGTDGAFEGRVLGVDATGALLVRDDRGARRTVTAGQVRILD